ncbi:hypothetical protein L598_007100000060 [Mesorhizobium sp. J18]|nr:hypothetical protein L598_007100000060 [Mesorhizobium sp. J18]
MDVSAYHEAPPHCADAVPADANMHNATTGARKARHKSFCIEEPLSNQTTASAARKQIGQSGDGEKKCQARLESAENIW